MYKISKDLIFEADYQNCLKIKYQNALSKVWDGREKMIKYDMNKIAFLIPICEGKYIISLDKPTLEKEFSFGYSDVGQGLSYEENYERISNFKENLAENFKERNLSSVNSMIKTLKEIIDGNSSKKAYHFVRYFTDNTSIVHALGFGDPWRGKSFSGQGYELEKKDLEKILLGYMYLKELTEKKINTYLRQYGTSKIRVSSYWIDR